MSVLTAARKAVPAVDFALGVAGMAAAGAIAAAFLGRGKAAIIIFAAILIAMVLLLIFSRLVADKRSRSIVQAGAILLWAVLVFFCTFLLFTVTAFAFQWPPTWCSFLGISGALPPAASPSAIHETVDDIGATIDFTNVQQNTDAVASLEGIARANPSESDHVIAILEQKALHTTNISDSDGRAIKANIFEALLRLRNNDLHREFGDTGLRNQDLPNLAFDRTNFEGMNFDGAFLIGSSFRSADLKGAHFDGADMRNVDFTDAVLNNADFSNTDWFDAYGLTRDAFRLILPTGLEPCPQKNGHSSQEAFVQDVDARYQVAFNDWPSDSRSTMTTYWAQYMAPSGLCDLVKTIMNNTK